MNGVVPVASPTHWTRLIVSAALGGVLIASIFGHVRTTVGPFGLLLSWNVAHTPSTQLNFPPLGDVTARTHKGPSRVTITLENLDFNQLRQLINESADDHHQFVRALTPGVRQTISNFILRLILAGTLGGAATAFLAHGAGRNTQLRRTLGIGALTGFLAVGSIVYVTQATFSADAFRSPKYRGALEEIPWLIRTVQEGLAHVEELDARLRRLSQSVYDMYRRVESLPPPTSLTEADLVILHVSDFHNHPTAASLVVEMAQAFNADIVLNTGDLTDFGTRLETSLLRDFSRLEIPHFLVSGNHETPEVLEHIALLPYIELIDGRQIEVLGINIAAIADPAAMTESAQSLTPAAARQVAEEINSALEAMVQRPDILAIHNHRVAQDVHPGLVPLIVFGHSHTAGVQFKGGTAYVNAGSTGGAGIRGLEANRVVPITMNVIYINHGQDKTQVLAVDMLQLSPDASGFSLERRIAPLH